MINAILSSLQKYQVILTGENKLPWLVLWWLTKSQKKIYLRFEMLKELFLYIAWVFRQLVFLLKTFNISWEFNNFDFMPAPIDRNRHLQFTNPLD